MSKVTRGTEALDKAKVAYTVHTYDYDAAAEKIGLQAAEGIGVAPELLLKTLMAEVDGKPVCLLIPSNHEVSMKKLAHAVGGKSATMMKPDAAERLSGYRVGGIGPFGQRRQVTTVIEESALTHPRVYVNAGQRGVLVELSPEEAQKTLKALAAPLLAE